MADSELPDGVDSEQMHRILSRVLEAERDKLHMVKPLGINDDIEAIIRDEVN